MKFYDSEREIDYYLREGKPEERINAICSMETRKENYERFEEIFISDENIRVKGNALCGAIHSNPKMIWALMTHVIKSEALGQYQFLRIIAVHLLELHKKGEI